MKRSIVAFENLTENLLDLLVATYPDGYDDSDIIAFKNAKGEHINCVEVRTEDTIYLIKVSKRLSLAMEAHEDELEDDDTHDGDYDDDENLLEDSGDFDEDM